MADILSAARIGSMRKRSAEKIAAYIELGRAKSALCKLLNVYPPTFGDEICVVPIGECDKITREPDNNGMLVWLIEGGQGRYHVHGWVSRTAFGRKLSLPLNAVNIAERLYDLNEKELHNR
jgi:hypothetical protein